MKLSNVGRYQFELNFHASVRIPKAYKGYILKAAQAALSALPKPNLKSLLRPKLPYHLSITVVGPKKMGTLNYQYRKKARATDVLSFSRLEAGPNIIPDIGDLVLCLTQVKLNAKEHGVSLKEELQRITIHGVLHLFGYDHEKTPRQAKIMFTLQERILRSLRGAKKKKKKKPHRSSFCPPLIPSHKV